MKAIALVTFFLLFTGCVTGADHPIISIPSGSRFSILPFGDNDTSDGFNRSINNDFDDPVPFVVLYEASPLTRAMYEPATGAYLGAWLSWDMSIRDFEARTGRRHAVYVYDMFLGDVFPETWILQSIAAQATPLFIIHPPIDDSVVIHDAIEDFAIWLGAYNLPAFVVFYPLISGHGIELAAHRMLFRFARTVFRSHTPMAAFVWMAQTDYLPFYPGHDMVDWVAFPGLAPRCNEGGFKNDILADLESFYLYFQSYKPVMLLPLGISHFSRHGYAYHVREASEELIRVYQAIQDHFPRVGLVAYWNIRGATAQLDDFSITSESTLLSTYSKLIREPHFLSSIQRGSTGSTIQWMRSAFIGYYADERFFIDIRTLEDELNIRPSTLPENSLPTGVPEGFLDIALIDGYGSISQISADVDRKVINIRLGG